MNIYWFEIKTQLKSTIIWTICFVLLGYAFIKGVYPMYKEGAVQIKEMVQGMPPEFLKAFGMSDINTLFEFGGFYGFIFGYMALIGAIMSIIVSVAIFSREKRAKCMDFLITKPVFRRKIFLGKFLAGLTILTALNIFYVVALYLLQMDTSKEFILSLFSLYFTQLFFYSIGILLAIILKRIRSVSGIAMATGITAFALSAIIGLLEKPQLMILAPLKYFDPGAVYINGGYTSKYVVTAIIIFIVCIGFSYIKFSKSDVDAV